MCNVGPFWRTDRLRNLQKWLIINCPSVLGWSFRAALVFFASLSSALQNNSPPIVFAAQYYHFYTLLRPQYQSIVPGLSPPGLKGETTSNQQGTNPLGPSCKAANNFTRKQGPLQQSPFCRQPSRLETHRL